ncbi:MAG: class I SAM-dependent methyltransferase [Bacteroidales bacterium]
MKEILLEPILRKMRINKVLPIIKKFKNPKLLDIGCGRKAELLKSVEPYILKGVGIDFKALPFETPKIKTIKMFLNDILPFEKSAFDIVTMLAVLEHISDPIPLAREINRVLCWDGILILTVPSKASKPILEFLSYKLNIVDQEEIRDHKIYYDRKDIEELFASAGFKLQSHKYFQFGMNNFCILEKI